MDIALCVATTLFIIFVVPVLIYSLFVKYAELKEPDKRLSFMASVLIQKIGTALGFVALFVIGREHFSEIWLLYGLVWAVMFAIVEVGQALLPNYSKKEAIAGIISEFIYFPLAALIVAIILT